MNEKKSFSFRLSSKKYGDGLKKSLDILKDNNINISGLIRDAINNEAERIKKLKGDE